MSDIAALEGRITAALDRIRQGLEAAGSGAAARDALQAELDAEKQGRAQDLEVMSALKAEVDAARDEKAAMAEALRVASEGKDVEVAALTQAAASQAASHQEQIRKLDEELQRLRASNAQMREMNTQLREAVTAGLAPELIADAAAAEVAAMQAQRSAEAAEIDTLLASLKPLLQEAEDAAN